MGGIVLAIQAYPTLTACLTFISFSLESQMM